MTLLPLRSIPVRRELLSVFLLSTLERGRHIAETPYIRTTADTWAAPVSFLLTFCLDHIRELIFPQKYNLIPALSPDRPTLLSVLYTFPGIEFHSSGTLVPYLVSYLDQSARFEQ